MTPHHDRLAEIGTAFRAFVGDQSYPCLAGRGVVHSERLALRVYGALGSSRSTTALSRDLSAFLSAPATGDASRAFAAVFPARPPRDERGFEQQLWRQLQLLHERDDSAAPWAPGTSADPADPRFGFSFAGHALFVIGLHAASSRDARRFRWPALVFNLHAQFARLREAGQFDRMRGMVRAREMALQGSLNPNLADFGERSEARQYSGRAVEADWQCPFHRKVR
jgi:FPC/CPF motif-containing protein YcgG